MHGKPRDLFDGMDEIFVRLFSRMDREFNENAFPGPGYLFRFRDAPEGLEQELTPGDADDPHDPTGMPVAEVHRIGDEVMVIADLPGITEEALRLDIRGSALVIDAGDASHHYRTSAELPPVDPSSMKKTLKNGVLEVTFRASA
jgi:HSP20 family protein